jgi:DUF4097 and DUF4098 domain-containing protein YvlB
MKKIIIHLLLVPLLMTTSILAILLTGCLGYNENAERSINIPVVSITGVRINSLAGNLEINGQSDLTEIIANGTAYAQSESDLDRLQFVTQTKGTEIIIDMVTPPNNSPPTNSKFDVIFEIPDSFHVTIVDTSGEIKIQNTAEVKITDASGDVQIDDVTGVRITDASGGVLISNVQGDVIVVGDGSGHLNINNIKGNVEIFDDGSGDIIVSEVDGNFHLGNDSSGDITARDIHGDFTVDSDESGSITYSNIDGRVEIPSD